MSEELAHNSRQCLHLVPKIHYCDEQLNHRRLISVIAELYDLVVEGSDILKEIYRGDTLKKIKLVDGIKLKDY